jgi:hypothetical protein
MPQNLRLIFKRKTRNSRLRVLRSMARFHLESAWGYISRNP